MKTIVVIPTYNERQNICELLENIYSTNNNIEILIIDDNSEDKTYELVEELIKSKYNEKLHIIKRSGKLGLGTAYVTGFKWALSKDYDYIIQMDADLSHNPIYITNFLNEIKDYDLILGSRYIENGGVKNWNKFRKFVSKCGNIYAKLVLRMPFTDLTGGYKCFKRKVLEDIILDSIQSNGYCFQIEVTFKAWLKKFKIKEIPIIFEERHEGKSKMSRKIFLEAFTVVLLLRKVKYK